MSYKKEPSEEFLSPFRDRKSAVKNLTALAGHLKNNASFENLRNMFIDNPNPDQALNILLRFIDAGCYSDIGKSIDSITNISLLIKLFGYSEYYADVIIRRSDMFSDFILKNNIHDEFLILPKSEYFLPTSAVTLTDALHQLRLYKEKAYFHIGVRNIIKLTNLETTIANLSLLADFVIQNSLILAEFSLSKKYEIDNNSFCVISVGKLGGQELNYSSDIDLLYLYQDDYSNSDSFDKTEVYSYCSELASLLSLYLTDKTDDLQMYRVDLRLRPHGEAGPIVRDISSYLRYYEQSGQTWERQMLIKARISAGNADTGEHFLQMIKPWVYARSPEINYIKDIYKIKVRSERIPNASNNIKLFSGGIRDIESICQTLQHLYGGIDKSLRGNGTIESIKLLKSKGKLSSSESQLLYDSYVFFRNLEHSLQYPHNRQTHSLPSDTNSKHSLAKRMSLNKWEDLEKEISRTRKNVRAIFNDIFKTESEEINTDLIFNSEDTDEVALDVVATMGFNDRKSSLRNLRFLSKGHPPNIFPESVQLKFRKVWNLLYHNLYRSANMDIALNNLEKIVHSYAAPGALYDLFIERPDFLKLLIFLTGSSSKLVDQLASKPEIFDSIFQPGDLLNQSNLRKSFIFETRNKKNFSDFANSSYSFMIKQQIVVYLWYLLGNRSLESIENALTNIADLILKESIELIYSTNGLNIPLSLLTLGNLGRKEIGFASDIDLIFVLAPQDNQKVNTRDIETGTKFAQLFSDLISGSKGSPTLYKIDYRMRPEGRNAMLIATLPDLLHYLDDRAAPWEILAYMNTRSIWNSHNANDNVGGLIRAAVHQRGLIKNDKKSLQDLTQKTRKEKHISGEFNLKWNEGCMHDIQNIVWLYQLRYSSKYHILTSYHSTIGLLEQLEIAGVINSNDSNELSTAYKFYRFVDQHLYMSLNKSNGILPDKSADIQYLSEVIGLTQSNNLTEMLKEYADLVKEIVERLNQALEN